MSALDRALPAPGRLPGTLPWLVAATAFIMLLAVAAALALAGMARGLGAQTRGRMIVQVIDADGTRRDARTAQATRLLATMPGIVAVVRRSDQETASLVAPYIGDVALADLPLPVLIEAELAPDADRTAIAARLNRLPAVHADAGGGALAPFARLIAALRWLAVATALLGGGATALVTTLAARSALAGHGETIAILHGLGATDGQVARLIGRRMLRDAGIGAALGLAGATCAILLIARRLAALESGLGARALLGWADWLQLVLLAGAVAALAALAAHVALLIVLRRAP
jgi:cell division transport system permease protein